MGNSVERNRGVSDIVVMNDIPTGSTSMELENRDIITDQGSMMTVSPDGKYIAYLKRGRSIKLVIRSTQNDDLQKLFTLPTDPIGSLAFSADSTRVISSFKGSAEVSYFGVDGSEQTWMMEAIHPFTTHSNDFYQFISSKFEEKLMVIVGQHAILVDAKNFRPICNKWVQDDISVAVFSHCGTFVALGMKTMPIVKLWDVKTDKVTDIQTKSSGISDISFTKDGGSLVISSSFHHSLESYNLSKSKSECYITLPLRSRDVHYPLRSGFDPSFEYMITTDFNTIKLWNIEGKQLVTNEHLDDLDDSEFILEYSLNLSQAKLFVQTSSNHIYSYSMNVCRKIKN